MKIAMPVSNGKLCMHFGHCEKFAVFEVNENSKQVLAREYLDAPPHQPGLLPRWLAEKGVSCVIAGGMGSRAVDIFREHRVRVITGAQAGDPEQIVEAFLHESLVTGDNVCDH